MLNAERGDCASVAKIIEQSQGEQQLKQLKLKKNIFLDIILYTFCKIPISQERRDNQINQICISRHFTLHIVLSTKLVNVKC